MLTGLLTLVQPMTSRIDGRVTKEGRREGIVIYTAVEGQQWKSTNIYEHFCSQGRSPSSEIFVVVVSRSSESEDVLSRPHKPTQVSDL